MTANPFPTPQRVRGVSPSEDREMDPEYYKWDEKTRKWTQRMGRFDKFPQSEPPSQISNWWLIIFGMRILPSVVGAWFDGLHRKVRGSVGNPKWARQNGKGDERRNDVENAVTVAGRRANIEQQLSQEEVEKQNGKGKGKG